MIYQLQNKFFLNRPTTITALTPDYLCSQILQQQHDTFDLKTYQVQYESSTGKSFSEALIVASTNPQYDNR